MEGNKTSSYYDFLFTELADPRTNSWFLIKDPGPPLTILIFYWYFVKKLGPNIMKDKEPVEMRAFLIIYNFLHVLLSAWIFVEALDCGWLRKYSWKCQPVDYSDSPHGLRVARGVYIYFLAKMVELFDTVFFVLRKKFNQVSFLHLYHHISMAALSWGGVKYFPGGHFTFLGLVNSFVHIIMYTYYMLAACGPEYQRFLWWKKYLTKLQLIQFCLVFIHGSQLFFYDCGYPRWTVVIILPNAVFFYLLFMDFYNQAYEKSKPNKLENCENINNADTISDLTVLKKIE